MSQITVGLLKSCSMRLVHEKLDRSQITGLCILFFVLIDFFFSFFIHQLLVQFHVLGKIDVVKLSYTVSATITTFK